METPGIKSPDAFGFRLLFFLLLLTTSVTVRGFSIGHSSYHQSTLYADTLVVALLLFFMFLSTIFEGRLPLIRNFHAFIPLILLNLWWGISGLMYAQKGDLFAASMTQSAVALLAAVLFPGLLERYRLTTRFLDLFLKFSLAVSAVAGVQIMLDLSRIFNDATATLGPNRAQLGLYMMLAFTVALYRIQQGGGRLAMTAAWVSFITVALSGSRASQIGCLFTFLPFLLTHLNFKNILRFLALGLALGVMLLYIGHSREGKRSETAFEISENVKIDQSAGRRILIWYASWNVITRSPQNFMVGIGFTNFRWEREVTAKLPFYTNAAHEVFLHVWTETGLLGLLLFIATLAAIFKRSLTIGRKRPEARVLAGLIAGVLFTGFTQESLYPNEAFCNFNTLFFLMAAVLLCDGVREREMATDDSAAPMPLAGLA